MALRDFTRPPADLVARYVDVARCYSASCVFADVQSTERERMSPSPLYFCSSRW